MISEKQLAANRRNALLSRGPVSAAGKRRCGLNNLRHGLTGHTTVLSEEERAAHDRFCAGIVACLQPEGALELQMAQSIADDHWRLGQALSPKCVGAPERRGRNIFALGEGESPASENDSADAEIDAALNSARVFLAEATQFALLSLYEQRIHRNLQKSIAEFRSLQSARKEQAANGQPKPVNNLPERLLVHPAENGFDFSNDPIRPPIPPAHIMNPAEFVRSGVAASG